MTNKRENFEELLKREREIYRDRIREWAEHHGQFVLIKGETVVGFYPTYSETIEKGYTEFGLEPFYVKQVCMLGQVHFIPHSVENLDASLHSEH